MALAQYVRTDGVVGSAQHASSEIRLGLFGLGQVGSAVATLAREHPEALGRRLRIVSALVRDPAARARPEGVPLATSPREVFEKEPTVVVEALGGLEPARSVVLEAIARGIPVVTANKSLLAQHGDELLDAAAAAGVPLCYEASVIAGVPFLGTLSRRPLASSLTSFTGIVNGTTNYILTQLDRVGGTYHAALAAAQRHGFAEPDPSKDVDGLDAAEKLVVLLTQFTACRIPPGALETSGIRQITASDLSHARGLGGTIKPVVYAAWRGAAVEAFAGPAFVPAEHPLAHLHGANNGICLRDRAGSQLCFSGPGAGPDATAITLLDDVGEAMSNQVRRSSISWGQATVTSPSTRWLVKISTESRLPPGIEIADLLGSHGIWIQRTSAQDARESGEAVWLLTYPCAESRLGAARAALSASTGCATRAIRALEDPA
jgi:homoserine dehydrogenase